jgi:hypothetical protein
MKVIDLLPRQMTGSNVPLPHVIIYKEQSGKGRFQMSLIDRSVLHKTYYVYTAECGVQFAAHDEAQMVRWVERHSVLCHKVKHALS